MFEHFNDAAAMELWSSILPPLINLNLWKNAKLQQQEHSAHSTVAQVRWLENSESGLTR